MTPIFSQAALPFGQFSIFPMFIRSVMLATVLAFPVTSHADEESLLINGDFEQVEQIKPEEEDRYNIGQWILGNTPGLFPKQWAVHESHPGTITIVSDDVRSGKYALKVQKGWVYNGFRCASQALLKLRFWAKGSGSVKVMLFQYEKGPDGSVFQFLPTAEVKTIELGGEWQEYTFEHQGDHPDVNEVALAFAVSEEMLVDDIAVCMP